MFESLINGFQALRQQTASSNVPHQQQAPVPRPATGGGGRAPSVVHPGPAPVNDQCVRCGGIVEWSQQHSRPRCIYCGHVERRPSAGAVDDPRQTKLNDLQTKARILLLVAAVGIMTGFAWITGPLSWYFGRHLRREYEAIGEAPIPAANWAYGVGVVSSIVSAIALLSGLAAAIWAKSATGLRP